MKLIFDIGFNHGYFSKAMLGLFNNCKILAVEANPDLVNDWNLNNGVKYSNVILINNLVSDKNNQLIDFYIEKAQDGISTASRDFMNISRFNKGSVNLSPKSANWSKPVKIRSITLDVLIDQYGMPDLIKLDIEGYEYIALNGLTKKPKIINFEWHEELYDVAEQSVQRLKKIGYKRFGVVGYFTPESRKDRFTFSAKGDPYLTIPKKFMTWESLNLKAECNKDRRVNYGMIWAKR